MKTPAYSALLIFSLIISFVCGCGNKEVTTALDSDANGYQCAECGEKFYTDRKIFANTCPKCKSGNLLQVVGYHCEQDKHTTLAPRGRGRRTCEVCKKPTTGMIVPKESDFKAWGATKKTAPEVGA